MIFPLLLSLHWIENDNGALPKFYFLLFQRQLGLMAFCNEMFQTCSLELWSVKDALVATGTWPGLLCPVETVRRIKIWRLSRRLSTSSGGFLSKRLFRLIRTKHAERQVNSSTNAGYYCRCEDSYIFCIDLFFPEDNEHVHLLWWNALPRSSWTAFVDVPGSQLKFPFITDAFHENWHFNLLYFWKEERWNNSKILINNYFFTNDL